jgi:hypothetical protein
MKVAYLVKLSLFALLLELTSLVIAHWVGIRAERVSMMVISLFSVSVLVELLFQVMQRQKKSGYLIKYFVFSGVKIFVVLILAYLFLRPESIENRLEALFFLFNYLAFLIYDITLKVKFISKNTN